MLCRAAGWVLVLNGRVLLAGKVAELLLVRSVLYGWQHCSQLRIPVPTWLKEGWYSAVWCQAVNKHEAF